MAFFLDYLHLIEFTQVNRSIRQWLLDIARSNERGLIPESIQREFNHPRWKPANYITSLIFPFQQRFFFLQNKIQQLAFSNFISEF